MALFSQAPRMRGKELNTVLFIVSDGITPAYAGKRPACTRLRACTWDHPRVCGEKHKRKAGTDTALGSPPRMRGKVSKRFFLGAAYRITPAYAGKSTSRISLRSWSADHPRVCGEKVLRAVSSSRSRGSPPRMRGKAVKTLTTRSSSGITPAYAGKS